MTGALWEAVPLLAAMEVHGAAKTVADRNTALSGRLFVAKLFVSMLREEQAVALTGLTGGGVRKPRPCSA